MKLRTENIRKLSETEFDVLIVGGGINGAVAAASLSAKGVRTALIDKGDFAGETSSNSSNLIWGGIKYLESFEFLLVNRLCESRNRLMRHYPSTVREIRFLTTMQRGFRLPVILAYLGTVLYWLIGRCFTRPPAYLTRRGLRREESIIDTGNAVGAVEYSDCYLHDNDSRFVFNFIRSAMKNGCIAANYVDSNAAERAGGHWQVAARDNIDGGRINIRAKVLINACGPQVDAYNRLTGQVTRHRHVFSKGIHLIVDRVTPRQRVLAFFASDGRLFFVMPMGPKTCIGTTDTPVDNPSVTVTAEDRKFVLDNVNGLLKLSRPLSEEDIVAERCGVRPLVLRQGQQVSGWMQLSRKHVIEVNDSDCHISIFGGKLTDCLNVGDEVADIARSLGVVFPDPDRQWYGEPPGEVRHEFFNQARQMDLDKFTAATASELLSQRLWRRYGEDAFRLLEDIRRDPSQATLQIANAEYLRCEIEEAAHSEMVTRLEDFLRRRSKISQVFRHRDLAGAQGLREACEILFGEQAEAKLGEYLRQFG